ncbi:MAG: TIGR00730 family Rossman fold protein [Paludibacteraceae bacterium]|nr:TIGR00730 family Rossman fold protein [Paludibacteraceae bacterium]
MRIAVYCSANNRVGEEYKSLARALGTWLAENGHTLVFGGATGGLMSEVSAGAREAGGEVIGVIPPRIIAAGRKSPMCTECVEVANMSERKQRMRELADGFVCLPGSYGTMDEMMDVISSGIVGEHKKPVWILNYKGFYDPLREQIARMKDLSFIPADEHYKPTFVDTLDQLYEEIINLKTK